MVNMAECLPAKVEVLDKRVGTERVERQCVLFQGVDEQSAIDDLQGFRRVDNLIHLFDQVGIQRVEFLRFTNLPLHGGLRINERRNLVHPFLPTREQCQFLVVGGKFLVVVAQAESKPGVTCT